MDKYYRNLIVVFVVAAVAVIVAALIFVNRPRSSMGPMASAERAKELALDGKREQVVTVSDGMIPLHEPAVDGRVPSPRLFAIPIGQITLAEPQRTSGSSYGGRTYAYDGTYRGFHGNASSDDSPAVFGSFNNIILFDKADGSLKKIFDKRIAVSAFKLMNRTARRALIVNATAADSDRDGTVDGTDIQSLYIYTFDDGTLHEVSGIEGSAGMAIDMHDVDYVVVEATLDTDGDGRTGMRSYIGGTGPEPQRLYRVDLRTFAATPLLDGKLIDDLQTTLDGLQKSAQTTK